MEPTYTFRDPIVRRSLPVWGIALLLILTTGCMGSGAMSGGGEGPWTERLELEIGERGIFADGSLVTVPPYRIYLLSADAGRRAVIAVGPAG